MPARIVVATVAAAVLCCGTVSESRAETNGLRVFDRKVRIHHPGIPETVKPGQKPISLSQPFLAELLPELRSPRLMKWDDLGRAFRESFLEGGFTFVLRGDFDRDSQADVAFLGKCHDEIGSERTFLAIITFVGGEVIRQHLEVFPDREVCLILRPNLRTGIDAIAMLLNFWSDECAYLYWDVNTWVRETCLEVNQRELDLDRPPQ